MLVHRSGAVPSLDQVVLVRTIADRPIPDILTGADPPLDENRSREWLGKIGMIWQRELYLEIADFAAAQ